MESQSLGFIGVGHLASYVIAGLRSAGIDNPIILSPRGAQQSQRLSDQYQCSIAADNQAVVDQSDVVFLAVRPDDLSAVAENLTFTSRHLLVSCLAGVSLDQLYERFAPAGVVRTLPLATAEFHEGVVPLYPAHTKARTLLSALGKVVTYDTEAAFELSSVAACMNGWLYAWMGQMSDWFTEQGMDADEARDLIVHTVRGATGLAIGKPEQSLLGITDSIATDGTYTKLGLDALTANGGLKGWEDALACVHKKLS
jgi:pyrroline-5-carboxylate reductase